MTTWDELTVGAAAPEREYGPISRTDIVQYQGASGDFNPIHHDDDFAKSAGYPGAFSVGMLQAGILASYATDWLGPRNVRKFGVQFREQVWPGDTLVCSGTVVGRDEFQIDGACVLITLDHSAGTHEPITRPHLLAELHAELAHVARTEPIRREARQDAGLEHSDGERAGVARRLRELVVVMYRIEVTRRALVLHDVGTRDGAVLAIGCGRADGEIVTKIDSDRRVRRHDRVLLRAERLHFLGLALTCQQVGGVGAADRTGDQGDDDEEPRTDDRDPLGVAEQRWLSRRCERRGR